MKRLIFLACSVIAISSQAKEFKNLKPLPLGSIHFNADYGQGEGVKEFTTCIDKPFQSLKDYDKIKVDIIEDTEVRGYARAYGTSDGLFIDLTVEYKVVDKNTMDSWVRVKDGVTIYIRAKYLGPC